MSVCTTFLIKPDINKWAYLNRTSSNFVPFPPMANTAPPNLHQSAFLVDELAYNAKQFLNTASNIEDYNMRRLFVELTRMPTCQTIRRYTVNELVHHWSSVVPEPGDGTAVFYRVDLGMFLSAIFSMPSHRVSFLIESRRVGMSNFGRPAVRILTS